jgi:glucose-6-phosphate dehydrogenase assembly protein OpcA
MVRPETILKELSKLWVDLGHEDQQDSVAASSGVLRACAMTFITIADESEDPSNLGETVAMLMKEHPSRSVLIRLRPTGEELIESRVFAQCWMPFGQHRQICCEQIEITASLASLDDVPGVVLPLAVPDLPVILWSRSPRLFDLPAFPKITAMCDKLILDTGAFTYGVHAFDLLSTQLQGERLVADLAWSRITRWRETVSQVFVNQECLDALPSFTRVVVEYGTEKPKPEAMYLAAWLQNCLTAVDSKTRVDLVKSEGSTIVAITLSAGGTCDVSIRAVGEGAVEVTANRLSTKTYFPEPTDYLALLEELSITRRDAAFDAAVPVACEYARQIQ